MKKGALVQPLLSLSEPGFALAAVLYGSVSIAIGETIS